MQLNISTASSKWKNSHTNNATSDASKNVRNPTHPRITAIAVPAYTMLGIASSARSSTVSAGAADDAEEDGAEPATDDADTDARWLRRRRAAVDSAAAASSKDAALLVTLPPGGYTVEVTGVNATTGVALVEVYEVP